MKSLSKDSNINCNMYHVLTVTLLSNTSLSFYLLFGCHTANFGPLWTTILISVYWWCLFRPGIQSKFVTRFGSKAPLSTHWGLNWESSDSECNSPKIAAARTQYLMDSSRMSRNAYTLQKRKTRITKYLNKNMEVRSLYTAKELTLKHLDIYLSSKKHFKKVFLCFQISDIIFSFETWTTWYILWLDTPTGVKIRIFNWTGCFKKQA